MALIATGLTTQIRNNHLKSVLLLAGFPLLLVLILFVFFSGMAALMHGGFPGPTDWVAVLQTGAEQARAQVPLALAAAGVWFCIAYVFHGSMMRAAAGARPVTRVEAPRAYNLLENLCISRGLPMPRLEMIDSPALNAFASGLNDRTFTITVTRGLVEALPDDELEGVLAHELTHIMNRDVRLLVISVIFVGMFSLLAQMAFRLLSQVARGGLYSGRRDRRENGAGAFVLLALGVVVLALGYVLALGIRFALSRRREYLADAGAVSLTKNPEAMMRALLRISGHDHVAGMSGSVRQMCIENTAGLTSLFATHPPIDDRVAEISRLTRTPIPMPPDGALARDAVMAAGPWGRRRS